MSYAKRWVERTHEETGLENAQKNAAGSELLPSLDEAHSEHDTTPENGDGSELVARAELADDEVGLVRGRGGSARCSRAKRERTRMDGQLTGNSKMMYGTKKMSVMME